MNNKITIWIIITSWPYRIKTCLTEEMEITKTLTKTTQMFLKEDNILIHIIQIQTNSSHTRQTILSWWLSNSSNKTINFELSYLKMQIITMPQSNPTFKIQMSSHGQNHQSPQIPDQTSTDRVKCTTFRNNNHLMAMGCNLLWCMIVHLLIQIVWVRCLRKISIQMIRIFWCTIIISKLVISKF